MESSMANTQEEQLHTIARDTRLNDDTLLRSIAWLSDHYGLGKSDDVLLAGLPVEQTLTPSLALDALKNAGITGGLIKRNSAELPEQVFPMILLRKGAGGMVLLARERRKNADDKWDLFYSLIMPEVGDEPVELNHEALSELYVGYAIAAKPTARIDSRVSDIAPPQPKGHWLFSTLWRYRSYYRSAALASVLVNVLALATVFFTMNVYDRVIPNQAFTTLWSLAIGVLVAMVFEAITRTVRAHLLDTAGKKADLIVGSILFRQSLAVKMEHKPASSGSFANQLREFESVRDFVSSATLATIADLPFVLLFIGIIFAIGGSLAIIPLLMLPMILIVSLLIQWPLAKVMKASLQEASLKQGVLIESIEGMETLKSVGGESWMQSRWQKFSAMQSSSAAASKHYSTLAMNSVSFLQQLQTVMLIVTGVYLIDAGNLTQGALIGTVMLAGRVTAPLSQVIGLAVRYQQAKAALNSLNRLMEHPTDRSSDIDYIKQPELNGDIELKGVTFSYPAPPMQPNPEILKGVNLTIKPGERVAIVGKIGSGKSTLLRIIARLYTPVKGQLFSSGLDVNQIEPSDWRNNVGFVGQEARLFYGTLRENIMIGRQNASSDEFLHVLRLTGLDQIAARHPRGIHMPVGEQGNSLSGGQRQLVSLARTLLARPNLLLLDEPTSAMDSQTEALFLQHLKVATAGHTLVVVTHRPSLLALVDRMVIIDDGKIVADGPKQQVLAALNGTPANDSAPAKAATGKQPVEASA
ncbi:TPA: type I secretion system permease/ATPase [Enterobacter cloacae subsp. dissolvens]|uniref:type I secretion system permease/ATPase n=1 Tax=Enterobacter cloacae TaxID=550 RepID=UPI0027838501|nr:type I secretion system permease/ATPase [Enterobacter cloacae subsp. dissolvens]HDT0660724.1 type I secretion system permease/ATPase [Enterobacter cloacae subsp. dissolvens]